MPFIQIFELELPIVISMPLFIEVQHIDFIFGEREFYHTPNKILHFNFYVVIFESSAWIFIFADLFTKYWSCSWRVILQPVLPRRLLKIRGRIFSKEGGTDVNIFETSSSWIEDHEDEDDSSLKTQEGGCLASKRPRSPTQGLIGPTMKETLSLIP